MIGVMDAKNPSVPALTRAIAAAGSQSALGRALGTSQALVHKWLNSTNPLGAKHCVSIERIYAIPRRDLRPKDWQDIWPELAKPQSPKRKEVAHG